METPSKGKWDGLRAIIVARQSKDDKGTASTAAQVDFMLLELERVGLKYVDNKLLDGVAASAPQRITEIIQELFRRKETDDDFDVIAWQIEDRASRSGGEHGVWLEHEAKRHGLRVFFAGDEGVSRPYDPVVRVLKYESAKEATITTGQRSRQGQSKAKRTGFFRTAGPTSFGCHRLYLSEEDRPKFFIRNLEDGRQEQVDYKSGEIIGRFGTVGKKSRHRFRKQRIEYSLLIPGDPEQMRVVRIIFYLRYKRGWRGRRIAEFLNRHRILSPQGHDWSQRQVQIIYEHEAYTGVTFNDRTHSGRFFKGDKTLGYVPLNRDEVELVLKKTFAPKLNPQEDWDRIDQPYMYGFLPRDVRDLAIADHARLWSERADPTRPKRKTNAHPASDYLFSGMLQAKQDDAVLRGTLSGREGSTVPCYCHPKLRKPLKGSIYNRLIRADVLHEAAVKTLADLLIEAPDLRSRLRAMLQEQRRETVLSNIDVNALVAEAEEIDLQITTTVKALKGAALTAAADELDRLGKRRNTIEAQLKRARQTVATDQRPADQVVDHALAVLAGDSQQLLTLPVAPLRDLVLSYIVAAVVDMETKAVEFTVALPSWVTRVPPKTKNHVKKAENPLCPVQSTRSPTDAWTHHPWLTIACDYRSIVGSTTQPPCYVCRRAA
ncbi:MAG TPA: recombinase family protein [Tepidisphaeraceae bacterium]|jgi:hypothetical protein